MLAPTLTPAIKEKIESLTSSQIIVLSAIAKGLRPEVIAKKFGISDERVSIIKRRISAILGDDAGALYREYGRSLGFTDDGKGALLPELRKKTSNEIKLEIPEPDASVMVDRLSQLSVYAKELVGKMRAGVDIDRLPEVSKIRPVRIAVYVCEISRAVGVIPFGNINKTDRWRLVEKRIRELDLSDIET